MVIVWWFGTRGVFKQLANALVSLRLCAGWPGPLLGAHTTLSEGSCRGLYGALIMQDLYNFWLIGVLVVHTIAPAFAAYVGCLIRNTPIVFVL